MSAQLLLFMIILMEGYVVLSAELLAIRQIIPYVGSGTDTISIIIAAVLMPLAAGYYAGGLYRPVVIGTSRQSIRRKLIRNIVIASAFLLPGLSTLTVNMFFGTLLAEGYSHRLFLTTLYALIFIVTPVFLLGQTVPLVSNYFSKNRLPQITGKILFFSTIGSFFGAVLTTLVVMAFFGVNVAVMVIFALLLAIVALLEKSRKSLRLRQITTITIVAIVINSGFALRLVDIIETNQYNNVRIFTDKEGVRHFSLNSNNSSELAPDGTPSAYISFIEENFIYPATDTVKDILVIGAGGFTIGLEDSTNRYTFVDIDGSLKDLAEEHFLPAPLGENKTFIAAPARGFLKVNDKQYDLIVLDAYQGDTTIPEHLVTQEFFAAIRQALKPEGIMVANFIASPVFQSAFSRNLDATLRSVFPFVTRQVIGPFHSWDRQETNIANILYFYKESPDRKGQFYNDNKNRIFFDKPQRKPVTPQQLDTPHQPAANAIQ